MLPAAWVLALLLTPAAVWLAGGRQPVLAYAPKAERPVLSLAALQDPATFTQLDTWFLDRIPLRGPALRARSSLLVEALKTSPSPSIRIGDQRWLYFTDEVLQCTPWFSTNRPGVTLELMLGALRASGRRAGLTLIVGKSAARGPRLDPHHWRDPRVACSANQERALQRRYEALPDPLLAQRALDRVQASGQETYMRNDSHWSSHGRLAYVRAVLDWLQPGLAARANVRLGGPMRWTGDLGRISGTRGQDTNHHLLSRPVRTGLRRGSVLLLGDSQNGIAFQGFGSKAPERGVQPTVLPGQRVCVWADVGTGECDAALRASRVVVLESIGRQLGRVEAQCARPLTIVGQGLRGRRAGWRSVAGAPAVDPRAITPSPQGVAMRIRPATGDRSDRHRLLRIPIRVLPGGPDGTPGIPATDGGPGTTPTASAPGVPATSSTPATPVAPGPENPPNTVTVQPVPTGEPPLPCLLGDPAGGRSLVVPLPAGRAASELPLLFHGPAGTVLGTPEEIDIDPRPRGTTR